MPYAIQCSRCSSFSPITPAGSAPNWLRLFEPTHGHSGMSGVISLADPSGTGVPCERYDLCQFCAEEFKAFLISKKMNIHVENGSFTVTPPEESQLGRTE